jgi:V-type H+-transporting ATPase subunit D
MKAKREAAEQNETDAKAQDSGPADILAGEDDDDVIF